MQNVLVQVKKVYLKNNDISLVLTYTNLMTRLALSPIYLRLFHKLSYSRHRLYNWLGHISPETAHSGEPEKTDNKLISIEFLNPH